MSDTTETDRLTFRQWLGVKAIRLGWKLIGVRVQIGQMTLPGGRVIKF